jgi:short-subunit dehydrogenase involved in D-alanine esterification of teichoic acids
MNLVLKGRYQEKLSQIAEEIKMNRSKIETKTVVNFSRDLVEGVSRLEKVIRGFDVGLLVNSAGISYLYARYFHEVDDELLKKLIKINVEGVTRVTNVVLSGMVERKRGAIVNIGSGAAPVIPSDPLYTVYAALRLLTDSYPVQLLKRWKLCQLRYQHHKHNIHNQHQKWSSNLYTIHIQTSIQNQIPIDTIMHRASILLFFLNLFSFQDNSNES